MRVKPVLHYTAFCAETIKESVEIKYNLFGLNSYFTSFPGYFNIFGYLSAPYRTCLDYEYIYVEEMKARKHF
jgi:hypothetical protein